MPGIAGPVHDAFLRCIDELPQKALFDGLFDDENGPQLLQEEIKESLENDTLLIEKVSVWSFDSNVNKIRVITISDQEGNSSQYCLIGESLGMFTDPDARPNIIENPYLAPTYISRNNNLDANLKQRANLIPFYEAGTLMEACAINKLMKPGEFNTYKLIYLLQSIQNNYFTAQQGVEISIDRLTAQGIATCESMLLCQENLKKHDKNRKSIQGIFSATQHVSKQDTPESKHIDVFFSSLISKIKHAIEFSNIDKQFDLSNLEQQLPEYQQSKHYLHRVHQSLDVFNNFISEEINQLSLNLGPVFEQHQHRVLMGMGAVLDLFINFEENHLVYFDIKPENFLLGENGLIIGDNKTLVRAQNNGNVINGSSHATYNLPAAEESHFSGEAILTSVQARQLSRYQIGAMLYNMMIGIPSSKLKNIAPHIVVSGQLLDRGLKSEFDFNHPCFKTEIGSFLESQIRQLTDANPHARPELETVRERYNEFCQSLQQRYENN